MSNSLNNNPSNPTAIGNPAPVTTHDNVVTFVSEGDRTELGFDVNEFSKEMNATMGDGVHDITDLLERPTVIYQGLLKSGDVRGADVTVFDVANKLAAVSTTGSPTSALWGSRLNMWYAMDCTMVVTVQVNSQAFQTGLYMLVYVPPDFSFAAQTSQRLQHSNALQVLNHNWMRATYLSGFDHVDLNLGATSEIVMKMPYVHPNRMARMRGLFMGTFHLVCLSALAGATNGETAGFQVFLHLEDTKLYGTGYGIASSTDLIPRQLPIARELTEQGFDLAQLKQLLDGLSPADEANQEEAAPTQAAAPLTGSGTSAPQSTQSTGTVSGIANTISKVASSLTMIPGVADIAGPASWIAKGIGSVASMFGASKPRSVSPVNEIVQCPTGDFLHIDGVDNNIRFTLNKASSTQVRTLGATNTDEMAIRHILDRPIIIDWLTWKTNHAARTQLYRIENIYPGQMYSTWKSTIDGHVTTVYLHTWLSYLSQYFMYWRGSIELVFTIVANKYYSGRLRLLYLPEGRTNTSLDSTAIDPTFYSQVVDVRDANTITASMPFIHVKDWARTDGIEVASLAEFILRVEMPLITSAVCSDEISIMVSLKAGDDFEFSVNNFNPFPQLSYTERLTRSLDEQGFTNNLTSDQTPAVLQMTTKPKSEGVALAHIGSIGDPIVSLRALAKRPTLASSILIDDAKHCLLLKPFQTSILSGTFQRCSMLDCINQMYAFRSGGTRFKIYGLSGHRVRAKLVSVTEFNSRGWKLDLFETGGVCTAVSPSNDTLFEFDELASAGDVPCIEELTGVIGLEIPFYSAWPMISNTPFTVGTTSSAPSKTLEHVPMCYGDFVVMLYLDGFSKDHLQVYVAADDDYNCGRLMAPPPTTEFQKPAALLRGSLNSSTSGGFLSTKEEAGQNSRDKEVS